MMSVLVLTICTSVVNTYLPLVVSWVLTYFCAASRHESALHLQERDLKRMMAGLSMVDEFAKHARLQRKLIKVQRELKDEVSKRSTRYKKKKLAFTYLIYAFTGVIILYTLWHYKFEPVVVFPSKWLFPFGSFLHWPSGIDGGIGISVWLLVLETTTRLSVSVLKLKS